MKLDTVVLPQSGVDPDKINSVPIHVLKAIESGVLYVPHGTGVWSARKLRRREMADPEHAAEYEVVDPWGGQHHVVTYANRAQAVADGVERLKGIYRGMANAIALGDVELATRCARQLVRECMADVEACAYWLLEVEATGKVPEIEN